MLYNCIFSICILFYLHEGSLPRQARKDTNPTEVYPFDRSLTSSTDMFSHFRSLRIHWGISCSVWLLPTHSHQKTDNPSVFHLSKSSCDWKLQLGCSGLGFFFPLLVFCTLKAASYTDLGKKANNTTGFPHTHTHLPPIWIQPKSLLHLTIKTYSKLHFNNCLNLHNFLHVIFT